MNRRFLFFVHWIIYLFLIFIFTGSFSVKAEDLSYVGSKKCFECHEEEYKNFIKFAKKAHSFNAVKRMSKDLSDKEIKTCYSCHTTGYGEPGGFIDEKKTPELKNGGCEVCHGPGSRHVQTEDAEDIIGNGKLNLSICEKCHSNERVKAFEFKPLLHGGAH